jgi:hypothetical protein
MDHEFIDCFLKDSPGGSFFIGDESLTKRWPVLHQNASKCMCHSLPFIVTFFTNSSVTCWGGEHYVAHISKETIEFQRVHNSFFFIAVHKNHNQAQQMVLHAFAVFVLIPSYLTCISDVVCHHHVEHITPNWD